MTCTKHHPKTRPIHEYLLKMAARRKRITGDCYSVFHTRRPRNVRTAARLDAALSMLRGGINAVWTLGEVRECILAIDNLRRTLGITRDEVHDCKYAQFCYMKKKFAMDLPRAVLSPAEARRLLDERCGFFRASEGLRAGISTQEQVRTWDPVCKVYPYGREEDAAEDADFVFTEVWGRPANEPLYVKARSFHGEESWEDGLPLD